MTDLTKLKELAERATPGRNFDRLPSAGGGLKYTCTGDDDSLVLRVDHKNGKFGFIGPKGEEDEAFFLACTPQAVIELIAEVERLRNRLEIDERTPYDGIACRDETIKGLDEKCDRLKAENEALRSALKPFAEYERVRSEIGGNAPRTGTLFGVNTRAGDAEITVEDMRAAQAALEGGGK